MARRVLSPKLKRVRKSLFVRAHKAGELLQVSRSVSSAVLRLQLRARTGVGCAERGNIP